MSETEHRPYWFRVGEAETTWDAATGEITQRMVGELSAAIYRTKEEGIRKALVALGWTPRPRTSCAGYRPTPRTTAATCDDHSGGTPTNTTRSRQTPGWLGSTRGNRRTERHDTERRR